MVMNMHQIKREYFQHVSLNAEKGLYVALTQWEFQMGYHEPNLDCTAELFS